MVRSQTEMCSFKGDCRESPLHILEPCGKKDGNGKHKRVQRKRPSRRVLHLEFCPDSVACQHLRLLSPSSACGFVILRQLLLSTQFPLGHETTAANPRRNGLNSVHSPLCRSQTDTVSPEFTDFSFSPYY